MHLSRFSHLFSITLAIGLAGNGLADTPTVVRFVPAVVDVRGLYGAHYTTEVTVLNDGTVPAAVTFTYVAAASMGASGSGTVTDLIPPLQELVLDNAIDWLRQKGLPIPFDGPQVGTLRVEVGVSGLWTGAVLARTTTQSGLGRAGTSVRARKLSELQEPAQFVFGLRQDSDERSNLAVAHAGNGGAITLRVSLLSEEGGKQPVTLPDVVLEAGQWRQWNSVLASAGMSGGYARIERVDGTDPFAVYGVINDNITNDGALSDGVSNLFSFGLRSVVVESSAFDTDAVFANVGPLPADLKISLEDSTALGQSTVSISLAPGEQRTIPHILDFLRVAGLPVGPRGPTYVWPLRVESAGSIYAFARTFAPAPGGGRYSEFNAVGEGGTTLIGLRQDESYRSNLALIRDTHFDYNFPGTSTHTYVFVFDGDTGQGYPLESAPSVGASPLSGGSTWCQWNSVLSAFGIRRGWVWVGYRCVGVPDQPYCPVYRSIAAYASIVDGARPGSGTGDATIVP